MRWREPQAGMPKFWIWTAKIIPDLWLSAVFCPLKKITLPYCTVYILVLVQGPNLTLLEQILNQ